MQKQKTKSSSFWYLVVCFIIVIASAKLLVVTMESFEKTHKVEAGVLPNLPENIQQNQTSNIIEDGYLNDKPFSFLKKIRTTAFPVVFVASQEQYKIKKILLYRY